MHLIIVSFLSSFSYKHLLTIRKSRDRSGKKSTRRVVYLSYIWVFLLITQVLSFGIRSTPADKIWLIDFFFWWKIRRTNHQPSQDCRCVNMYIRCSRLGITIDVFYSLFFISLVYVCLSVLKSWYLDKCCMIHHAITYRKLSWDYCVVSCRCSQYKQLWGKMITAGDMCQLCCCAD